MELESSVWLFGFIALFTGAIAGALAFKLFSPSVKQADQVKSELEEARAELDNYKKGVSQHFDKTAELVNDLAQNYVRVYKHLAEGAQTLGASKSFDLIEQNPSSSAIEVDDEPVSSETTDYDQER